MAVAVLPPFTPQTSLTPEYLSGNAAKILRPACASVLPAGLLADEAEGLALARRNNLGHVLFLQVENWETGAVAGSRATLFARIVNAADGSIVGAAAFEGSGATVNILYSSGDPWQTIAGQFQDWARQVVFFPPAAGKAP